MFIEPIAPTSPSAIDVEHAAAGATKASPPAPRCAGDDERGGGGSEASSTGAVDERADLAYPTLTRWQNELVQVVADPAAAAASLDAIVSGVDLTVADVVDAIGAIGGDAALLHALLEDVSGGVGSVLDRPAGGAPAADARRARLQRRAHVVLTKAVERDAFLDGRCLAAAIADAADPHAQQAALLLAWVLVEKRRMQHGHRAMVGACDTCAGFVRRFEAFVAARVAPVYSAALRQALLAVLTLPDPVDLARRRFAPLEALGAAVVRPATWGALFVAVERAAPPLAAESLRDLVALVDAPANCIAIAAAVPSWHRPLLRLLQARHSSVAAYSGAVLAALLYSAFATSAAFATLLADLYDDASRAGPGFALRPIVVRLVQRARRHAPQIVAARGDGDHNAAVWRNVLHLAAACRDLVVLNVPVAGARAAPLAGAPGFRFDVGGRLHEADRALLAGALALLRALKVDFGAVRDAPADTGIGARATLSLDARRYLAKARALAAALEDASLIAFLVERKAGREANVPAIDALVGAFVRDVGVARRRRSCVRALAALPNATPFDAAAVGAFIDGHLLSRARHESSGALVDRLRDGLVPCTVHTRFLGSCKRAGFTGKAFVDVLLDKGLARHREQARHVGLVLLATGAIAHAFGKHDATFTDNGDVFRFVAPH